MSNSIKFLKNDFRKKVRLLLKNVKNFDDQSNKIVTGLYNEEFFKESSHVCLYLPLKFEINLIPLLYKCFEMNKKAYIPVIMDSNKSHMEMLQVENESDFKSFKEIGKYKILEPTKESIPKREKLKDIANEIEKLLIIVPGLAFDKDFNRLGKGKGFYDRYLSKIMKEMKREDILLVALSTDTQYFENESIPHDEYDYPIDILLRYQDGKIIKEIRK